MRLAELIKFMDVTILMYSVHVSIHDELSHNQWVT